MTKMETNQNLNYIYTHGYHSSTTIAYLYVENEASFCASSERLQGYRRIFFYIIYRKPFCIMLLSIELVTGSTEKFLARI